jgi:copper(I)-binding protein
MVLSCALALAASGARADPHQVRQGDITVSSRVVRASIPGSPNSAAYMVIANAGAQPDALVGARCACAAKVDVHKSEDMHGMSMMLPAGPVVVPPHGQVLFQPGGYHLMLTGLKEPLRDHGQQEITLVFKRAGAIRASFRISAQINLGTEAPMRGMNH